MSAADDNARAERLDVAKCSCGAVTVKFDPADAGSDEFEVRKRWPRGHCATCYSIIYASPLHYLAGNW